MPQTLTPVERPDPQGPDHHDQTPRWLRPLKAWHHRVRTTPGTREAYRVAIFVIGLVFILGGIALAALPGPLTIPPVLLGLWVWSTEFRFADRFLDMFKDKGREAWAHAKRKPVSSAILTVGGLILAGVAFWAMAHFHLVDRAKDAIF